jgi:16S rRNA (guanine1516-N2)-methyltransferase
MTAALETAGKRVVVKRPRRATFFANQPPSYSLSGKTIRFDVYITRL